MRLLPLTLSGVALVRPSGDGGREAYSGLFTSLEFIAVSYSVKRNCGYLAQNTLYDGLPSPSPDIDGLGSPSYEHRE